MIRLKYDIWPITVVNILLILIDLIMLNSVSEQINTTLILIAFNLYVIATKK